MGLAGTGTRVFFLCGVVVALAAVLLFKVKSIYETGAG